MEPPSLFHERDTCVRALCRRFFFGVAFVLLATGHSHAQTLGLLPTRLHDDSYALAPTDATKRSTATSRRIEIAPELKITRIRKQGSLLAGLRVSKKLSSRISLGAAGYWLLNGLHVPVQVDDNRDRNPEARYGGIFAELLLNPEKPIQPKIGLLLGGGIGGFAVRRDSPNGTFSEMGNQFFGVLEPEAGIQIPLAKNLRMDITGGYRFVVGVNQYGLTNSDLRGFTAGLRFVTGF